MTTPPHDRTFTHALRVESDQRGGGRRVGPTISSEAQGFRYISVQGFGYYFLLFGGWGEEEKEAGGRKHDGK